MILISFSLNQSELLIIIYIQVPDKDPLAKPEEFKITFFFDPKDALTD